MADEKKPFNSHPNSLRNLKPVTDPDKAREMQLKSAASRKAKNVLAKKLNKSIKDWNIMKERIQIADAPSALDFLRFRMLQLMEEGKMIEAQELAKELVEFETPKLSRIDQTNKNIDVSDISDDELEAELIQLGVIRGGKE
jgi:predicted acyltransferase (DUF342 family)